MFRTKDERRHHRERIRAKTRRIVNLWKVQLPNGSVYDVEQKVNELYQNRAVCSCWMCGNRRRNGDGPTRQERKAQHDLLEWLAMPEMP